MIATADTVTMIDYLQRAGVLGLLAGAIIGSVRRWWFPAWYVDELARDRDQWKEMALSGTRLVERQLPLVEHAVRRGEEQQDRREGRR